MRTGLESYQNVGAFCFLGWYELVTGFMTCAEERLMADTSSLHLPSHLTIINNNAHHTVAAKGLAYYCGGVTVLGSARTRSQMSRMTTARYQTIVLRS